MSATVFKLTTGQKARKLDWKATMDNTYAWRCTGSFECNDEDVSSIVAACRVNSTTPTDIFGASFAWYTAKGIKFDNLEVADTGKPGFSSVTLNFGGVAVESEQQEENIAYSLTTSANLSPITEHPKWALMDTDDQSILGNAFSGAWSVSMFSDGSTVVVSEPTGNNYYLTSSDGDAFEFGKLLAKGKRLWVNPVMQWTQTKRTGARIKDSELAKLGKKDTPPGSAPDIQGRDWYLKEAEASRSRGVWSGSRVWESSGVDATLDETLFQ